MRDKIPWRRAGAALFFLVAGIIANNYATVYATDSISNSVTDIILSNIPTFNVDIFFVFGPVLFWIIIGVVLLRRPQKIPFALDNIALLLVIRSIFISLTHLGPFPGHLDVHRYDLWGFFSTGGDLFFSGHTALPFLMALVFWDNPRLRIFCIISSLFFGVIVLLAHVHYTIDVAAAFFITYTVYRIAVYFFKRDQVLFKHGMESA